MPLSSIVPLGRLGTPEEIAKVVVFLPSDDRSYLTATELFVDGGSHKCRRSPSLALAWRRRVSTEETSRDLARADTMMQEDEHHGGSVV